jgi:hypothetical protein
VVNGWLIFIESFDKAISNFLEEIYDTCNSMIVHFLATILVSAIKLLFRIVWASIISAYVSDLNTFPALTERELAVEEVQTCFCVE